MVTNVCGHSVRMRCWLTRPCIRWLRYVAALVVTLFLFSHGLVKLSRGKRGVNSVAFDNVITFYDDDPAKYSEKTGALPAKKYYDRDKLFSEDYDSEGDSLKEVYAKIDKDLEQPDSDNFVNNLMGYMTKAKQADVHVHVGHAEEQLSRNVKGNANFKAGITKVLDEEIEYSSSSNRSVNIIINSYGIRKSTVLDELFVNKPGAIIFYQPSLTLRSYWYLRGDNQVCSMKSPTCRLAGEDTSLLVLKCLVGLFQCSTEALAHCIAPLGVVTHPDVSKYNECKKKAQTEGEAVTCLRMLRLMCTSAKVKVISVRSVALDILEQLLDYIQIVKIIHVFRDSRPITLSEKTKVVTYLNKAGNRFFNRVQSLCERTQYDLDTGLDLQTRKTSNVFQMIAQENIINDTINTHVDLSSMFDMKITEEMTVYDVIGSDARTIISKHAEMDKAWRLNMDIGAITVAYNICQKVYEKLGYRLV